MDPPRKDESFKDYIQRVMDKFDRDLHAHLKYGEVIDTTAKEAEEKPLSEQELAEKMYPNHHPKTALANYRAGREVWDTNGDQW